MACKRKGQTECYISKDKSKARLLRLKAVRYILYDGQLYKRGFSTPLLKCVDLKEGNYIVWEIHEGIYGNLIRGQSLSHKALRQGYFWSTLRTDAMAFARKCDKCQRFSNIPRSHPKKLTSMTSPWPFAVWGIDLIGPLLTTRPTFKYVVIVVDYFTKWAEAKLLATISNKKVQDFVLEAIICRYSIPQEIVFDNGTQFNRKEFREFCSELNIKKNFSSVDHPQTNSQVEAVNKIIKHNLKTNLEEHKGVWADELPKVLWPYRMTSRTSTQDTPFSLAYRVEAMIPVEVGIPFLRHELTIQKKIIPLCVTS